MPNVVLTHARKRHVKCDEAKPSCQRCVKWQGFCDGYDAQTPSTLSSPSPSEPASVASTPKKKRRGPVPRFSSTLCPPPPQTPVRDDSKESPSLAGPLCASPQQRIFDDDLELRYFTTWYLSRAPTNGFFADAMWEQTIPQLSHHHASIRYAAMAVGAMSRTVRGGFKPRSAADLAAGGADYGLALSYYGKAMGALRGADVVDAGSLRAAVVCCLLFICFEALHGDGKAAFSHLDNAQRILDEMLQRARSDDVGSPFGSEALERDMLNTFQRFMLQSWSCGVLRPRFRDARPDESTAAQQTPPDLPWCCRGGFSKQRQVDDMPTSFQDLAAARHWWETTQHHVIHSSDMAFRFTHLDLPRDLVAECTSRVEKHMDKINGLVTEEPSDPLPPPSHDDLEALLARWLDAFHPLWDACVRGSGAGAGYDDFIRAAHLRVQYLTMYTCVSAPLSCDHGTIARLTPVFREIVDLSGLVLTHQGGEGDAQIDEAYDDNDDDEVEFPPEVFTMDTSPSWPLFLAGMRCRDLEVRERAVRLLGRHPRRDGLWDSRMFHALAMRNRAVEIWNARQGSREEQWWRLQARTAYIDGDGVLRARALTQNPASGAWEAGEHEVGVFMHMK